VTCHIRTKCRIEFMYLGIRPSSTTAVQFEVETSLVCFNRSQIKWLQIVAGININCALADRADLQEGSQVSMHVNYNYL